MQKLRIRSPRCRSTWCLVLSPSICEYHWTVLIDRYSINDNHFKSYLFLVKKLLHFKYNNASLIKNTNFYRSYLNSMEININVTKLIQFMPYQKTSLNINSEYKNQSLETVTLATLLGVEINMNLS